MFTLLQNLDSWEKEMKHVAIAVAISGLVTVVLLYLNNHGQLEFLAKKVEA